MKLFATLFTSLLLSGQLMATMAIVPAAAPTKSFSQWQMDRVQEALNKVTLTKAALQQITSKRAASMNLQQKDDLKIQLERELWELETAKDLSLNDYVGLYLVYQPQDESLAQVAKQLSSQEVTELLIRYTQLVKKSGEFREIAHPLQERELKSIASPRGSSIAPALNIVLPKSAFKSPLNP